MAEVKKPTKAQVRSAERRLVRARVALSLLTKEQRAALFREVGECNCAGLVQVAVENPAVGIGALVGGALGALFSTKRPVIVADGRIISSEEMRKLLGDGSGGK